MNRHYDRVAIVTSLLSAIFVAFFVYSSLTFLYVAPKITIPISIAISVLIFGLTRYYSKPYLKNGNTQGENSSHKDTSQNDLQYEREENDNRYLSTILFVTIFGTVLVISSFTPNQEFHLFTNWIHIGVLEITQLASSILLCFFIPGFAVVLILTKKSKINPILAVLIAYILSMLITGLVGYISALTFDVAISESKSLFITVYLFVLVVFLIFYPPYRFSNPIKLHSRRFLYFHLVENRFLKYCIKFRHELLVFGSLFSLIVISTYYLYGGITIGDQWYHQGRSLLFMSGEFREASITGAEAFYPPFQSALLAVLTVLSGVPLVNVYASIAFLNIIPVFAFLYFFCTWAPATMRKAGLLACTLFTLSSGFGWIYFLTSRTSSDIFSVQSSLETLRNLGHLDIVSASNFIIATAPDFSTGLIYMALPAGLVLLSIIRTPFQRTSTKVAIIATISILGVISHYEFYIFIIIASILPIIFKLKAGNSIYLGFFFAFFVVYLIDIIAPGSYLSSLEIGGLPLLLLAVSFVSITGIIYVGYRRFRMSLDSNLSFFSAKKFPLGVLSENFHLATLIVALVAFFYLFCFIVLNQLPLNSIIDQTFNNTYPWYLYPMKMGIAGLFGLAFILSYFFKKFEKQVFVFGIIMLVSFIAGPYYDEHRFSKYFMIGMVGFASIMIYELLNNKFINKPIIKSVFVAVIITSSSLSVLIFIGYNSLILQAQDFTNTLYRRHFPSDSDLRLYEFLHNKININSEYNVITFLKEYDRGEDGLVSKISAFAGLPYGKLLQDPLTLNASTIEALYYHLWYNDARYVIVSKDIFKTPSIVTDSTRFVIEHFTAVYENDNYIVLEVPSLVPPAPSSNASVALVYDQGMNLQEPRPSNTRLLQYNSNVYRLNSDNNLVSVQRDNQTERLNLSGSKSDRGISVWTKNIDQAKRANYIETEFSITNENESKANDIRIEWQEAGMREYYVKLSNDGLELYKKSDTGKGFLLKNSEFDKSNWKWYTLTIESLSNSINIYVDNVLKIQAPKITANDRDGITKIGLTSFYNDVQFKPVKIGTITNPGDTPRSSNYDYNYPLTLLALNKFKYDTFSDNDSSVFSKDAIVIPDSVLLDNVTINRYLDYVQDGGTLVILNSNGNLSSMTSKYFSLSSNQSNQEAFTHIYDNTNQKVIINMPGWINKSNAETLPDVHVIASYRNDKNETIAPFIVEKKIPTGGKIVLLNSQGFFNTISQFPKQYFPSLSNISVPLPIDKPVPLPSKNNSLPMQAYVGKLKVSGMVTLNSSSLLLEEGISTFPINASRIIIFNNDSKIPTITYKDVSIKDLKLMGDYHLNINFSGQSELPGISSYHDYIDMSIPTGSNMSVNLDSKSGGTIDIANQKGLETESVSLHNNSRVEFYELRTNTTFPVLVKEPQLSVNGDVYINNAYLGGYLTGRGKLDLGAPVDLRGRLSTNFAFVDNFYQPYHNATKIQYITYLQSLTMDGKLNQDKEDLKLPGDIYFKSKEKVPIVKIFSSPINIISMSALIIMVILLSNYLWKKKKLQP